ncbi:MAG: DNA-protecting protein DprA [Patulibacter sp.]|nr:DNA-protecting protein DprA [Patulibacter sp.]
MSACVACLRRTELLGDLSPAIDRRFHRNRPSGLLMLDDAALIRALAGPSGRQAAVPARLDDDVLRERCARNVREHAVAAICRHDDAYPRKLRELADPPAILHVLGGVERLHAVLGADGERPAVAIVGARRAPAEARAVAERFAGALASAGVTVISGMAFGIDAAAHGGALTGAVAAGSEGGSTVAVLAGGPERASPARNRALHARIACEGVVVSEMAPGTTPRPWGFPARNRLIAALADATVVIAAASRSGSLSTAHFALDLDRPVGVIPGAITSPAYAGSNRLLRDEPGTTVVLEPADVLALLGDRGGQITLPLAASDPLRGLEGLARKLGERLVDGPRTIEQLLVGHDPADVLACLADLEARGRLRRDFGGGISLVGPYDAGAGEGTDRP